ncbi:MAG: Ig-like domain-containing protein [Terriglobales bacterium]
MGRAALRVIFAIMVLVGASFAVSVSVSSPASNITVASPVTITASASSSHTITGWRIYVDSREAYGAGATQNISAPVAMSTGMHQVIVRAWDSTGAYASQALQLTVGAVSGAVVVSVASPANGASVVSPATITANASSAAPVTGWRIYVDGTEAYGAGATASISAPLNLSPGTHQVVVRAWNSYGAYGSAYLTLNASGSSGGPLAPAGATRVGNIEDTSNWFKCSSASCSGGIASAWSYWVAPFQTNPSLDGSSAQFFTSGPAYSTALFAAHLPHTTTPSRFIFEFDLYMDDASTTAAEALEFDLFHVYGGRKYVFGTECNYWTRTWAVWNEVAQRWIPSNAVCNKFQPKTWHHVKWAVERVGWQIRYLSVTVDGVTQYISDAYAYQPSAPTDWAEGAIAFQVQQDLSSHPGNGFHQWLDRITVWHW